MKFEKETKELRDKPQVSKLSQKLAEKKRQMIKDKEHKCGQM